LASAVCASAGNPRLLAAFKRIKPAKSAGECFDRLSTRNQLHALNATQQTPEVVSNSVKEDIKHLENQIDALSNHTLTVIEQNVEIKQSYELITGIKGIAKASAISILGEVLVLPDEMTARQWVAHAGLDPREHLLAAAFTYFDKLSTRKGAPKQSG